LDVAAPHYLHIAQPLRRKSFNAARPPLRALSAAWRAIGTGKLSQN
jgi:hypothetical protein